LGKVQSQIRAWGHHVLWGYLHTGPGTPDPLVSYSKTPSEALRVLERTKRGSTGGASHPLYLARVGRSEGDRRAFGQDLATVPLSKSCDDFTFMDGDHHSLCPPSHAQSPLPRVSNHCRLLRQPTSCSGHCRGGSAAWLWLPTYGHEKCEINLCRSAHFIQISRRRPQLH
jgi:hypothetical protein